MTITSLQTLGVAVLVVYFGRFLKSQFTFIDKYNLPSPVIGGFVVASVLSILKSYGLFELQFTKAYEESLMIIFFASVGYSASFNLLRAGGKMVVFFLALTVGGLILQILAGLGAAHLMGLPPLMGVLTGPVALTGGPGTALAFGASFEKGGLVGASAIGLTSAMGGILLGGLVGTPLATHLIQRRKLKKGGSKLEIQYDESQWLKVRTGKDLLLHALGIGIMMGAGTTLGGWIANLGITLPVYIGAMMIAAIIRNIEDVKPVFQLSPEWIEEIGSVALTLFIATAIMSLKLDELRNVALPILVFLAMQAVLVMLTALGPVFWISGKDYEGAIMSSGYVGFMMGTTANAMANMSSLTQKYGPAPKAFLVVPLVGSCFIDFINAALITLCLNLLV